MSMVLEDLFLLLQFFTHSSVFTCPNDGWTGLYIKLWCQWEISNFGMAGHVTYVRLCHMCMSASLWHRGAGTVSQANDVNTRCLSTSGCVTCVVRGYYQATLNIRNLSRGVTVIWWLHLSTRCNRTIADCTQWGGIYLVLTPGGWFRR